MKSVISFALALGLALGAQASAAPKPRILEPDWLERPTAADVGRFYPPLAQMIAVEGFALISCGVTEVGQLEGCQAKEERPKGLGFGGAGVRLGASFRMRPQMRDGKPTAEGEVQIPLTFRLPPQPKAPPGPASSPAMVAALRTARALGAAEPLMATRTQGMIRSALAAGRSGAPANGVAAMQKAIEDTRPANLAIVEQSIAEALARRFTAEELDAITAAMATPGQAVFRLDPHVDSLRNTRLYALLAEYQARARRVFCTGRSCAGTPEEAPAPVQPGENLLSAADLSERPTDFDLFSAAPRWTSRMDIRGVVRLTCAANTLGLLEKCVVAAASPKGLGFEDSALAVAGKHRVNPMQTALLKAGRSVSVDVNFRQTSRPQPASESQAVPPEALAAARIIAARLQLPPTFASSAAGNVEGDPAFPSSIIRPELKQAAIDAFQQAGEASSAAILEAETQTFAANYSTAELQSAAAFLETPLGQRYGASAFAILNEGIEILKLHEETITSNLREAYCSNRDCGLQTSVKPEPSTAKP